MSRTKRGEDKGENNTEKLLEVAQDEEEFCMGKWNGEKVEDIFITLKPQEWPNGHNNK